MGKTKLLKTINKIALWLVALGALNWLLIALLKLDLVATLTGTTLTSPLNAVGLAAGIYGLIGASGAWIGILALMGKIRIK